METWRCKNCEHINKYEDVSCEICGRGRPELPKPEIVDFRASKDEISYSPIRDVNKNDDKKIPSTNIEFHVPKSDEKKISRGQRFVVGFTYALIVACLMALPDLFSSGWMEKKISFNLYFIILIIAFIIGYIKGK